MEPYPHIAKKNALPWDLYNKLEAAYPSDRTIYDFFEGPKYRPMQNKRYDVRGFQIITADKKKTLDPIWAKFMAYHLSPAFYKCMWCNAQQEVVRVFGPAIRQSRPDVEAIAKKPLEELDAKMRLTKDQKADMLLEAQISLNSPLTKSFAVAGPHHDAITKVFAGLLYMRQDGDKSKGADLQGARTPAPYCWLTRGCRELYTRLEFHLGLHPGRGGRSQPHRCDIIITPPALPSSKCRAGVTLCHPSCLLHGCLLHGSNQAWTLQGLIERLRVGLDSPRAPLYLAIGGGCLPGRGTDPPGGKMGVLGGAIPPEEGSNGHAWMGRYVHVTCRGNPPYRPC
eukprot:280634-Pyramimonas_sp.AAC.1